MEKQNMHLGASSLIFERAKALRSSETKAEKMLWNSLSGRKLGVKFRRQHPILNYVVDFYCHSCKLAIELDGEVHDSKEQEFHDETRDKALEMHGVTVLRFSNVEVYAGIETVIDSIKEHLPK